MKDLKVSAGLWVYGPVPDRYLPTGYQLTLEIEERIKLASETVGISGLEVPFGPVIINENVEDMGELIKKHGLAISSVTVNVTGSRKWALGSLTNPDPAVRADAIKMIIDSMQAAKVLKVDRVNLWMGQEGFDYPFEADYATCGSLCGRVLRNVRRVLPR